MLKIQIEFIIKKKTNKIIYNTSTKIKSMIFYCKSYNKYLKFYKYYYIFFYKIDKHVLLVS